MANDTVVQYVLKIDAQGAEKGLDRTGKAAQETSQSMHRMEQATEETTKALQRNEKQSLLNIKTARNLRRAGRDLDGALGDLAQGVGVLNPQLGHFLMTASNGVSIVESFGRGLTLFANPAVLAAGVLAATAGAAIALYQYEQEQAEERAKALAEAVAESNRIIEEQSKIAQDAQLSMIDYAAQVEDARLKLQLITGQLTEYQNKQNQINATVDQYGSEQVESLNQERAALQQIAIEQDKKLQAINSEITLLKEARRIRQTTADEARFGAKFGSSTQQERDLKTEQRLLQQQRQETAKQLQINVDNLSVVQDQKKEYQDILNQILQTEQAQKRRAAAEKARQQAAKEEAALEREFARLEKEAEDRAKKADQERTKKLTDRKNALLQIYQIIETTSRLNESATQRINREYQEQVAQVRILAKESGAVNSAEEAILLLTQQRDIELAKINKTKQEGLDKQQEELDKQQEALANEDNLLKLIRRVRTERGKTTAAPDQLAQNVGSGVGAFQAVANVDAAGLIGLASPIAGAIAGTLIELGKKTPEELKAEVQAQAEALANGLAILPALFLEILPQLTVAIAEAVYDGIINLVINLVEIIKDRFNLLTSFRDRDPNGNNATRDAFMQGLRDFFDPSKSASYAAGGRFLPKAQGGIRFTGNQDGLAMLHRGEFVVPQSGQRPQQVDRQMQGMGGGLTVNINSAVVDRNAVDALVRQIEVRFNNQFGTSSSNLFGGR